MCCTLVADVDSTHFYFCNINQYDINVKCSLVLQWWWGLVTQ